LGTGGETVSAQLFELFCLASGSFEAINPDIPDRFDLISKADGTHTPCHVIWRDEERIGVAFDY
jgi:hypothetical protein